MLVNLISMNSYAQNDSSESSEGLISVGPFTFSSKIDLGMLIAAAAFASTIIYNIIQIRKGERNLRREMNEREKERELQEKNLKKEMEQRAVEQKQLMDAQQQQIKTQQDQIQNYGKISEAGFWLTLRDQMAKYDDIESYLLPGGKWYGPRRLGGPKTPDEWSRVESYMSLLGLLNAMIDHKVLSEEMFHRLYGPRINSIYYNDIVRREKLEREGRRWREFLHLCRRRRLDEVSFVTWPPFWVLVSVGYKVVSGDAMGQAVIVRVYDSIESLNSNVDVYVSDAKVATMVVYPSGKSKHFEGITGEQGDYIQNWVLKDEDNLPGEAKIIVKVSKGNKTSSAVKLNNQRLT
jgi:hypothetical protein